VSGGYGLMSDKLWFALRRQAAAWKKKNWRSPAGAPGSNRKVINELD
jgi:hypothetical protein